MPNYHGKSIGPDRYSLLESMAAKGSTAAQIAEHLGVEAETVRKYCRKRGIALARQDMSLEKHPSWKGGTTLDRSGYLLVRVDSEGPYGYLIRALQKRTTTPDRYGYAPEHRIVMHDKLGRRLLPGEVVDHIDSDRRNNHPDNLRVFASNKEHLQATLQGRVPKWSDEGWQSMCAPRPNYQRKVSQP